MSINSNYSIQTLTTMNSQVNTQLLDQIIFDSTMTLKDELLDLSQNPESFINSVCEKAYDEMSGAERTEASEFIAQYLEDNMGHGSRRRRWIVARIAEGYTHVWSPFESGPTFDHAVEMVTYCETSYMAAVEAVCAARGITPNHYDMVADKTFIWNLEEELVNEDLR